MLSPHNPESPRDAGQEYDWDSQLAELSGAAVPDPHSVRCFLAEAGVLPEESLLFIALQRHALSSAEMVYFLKMENISPDLREEVWQRFAQNKCNNNTLRELICRVPQVRVRAAEILGRRSFLTADDLALVIRYTESPELRHKCARELAELTATESRARVQQLFHLALNLV
jgi:hypothetical protein